jgi:hypothetical protein
MDSKFIAYYRVSTDHQGVNGNGMAAAPKAVLAKGGHSLYLFPEQTASASQPGDFLGGCGHGHRRDPARKCLGPADVTSQVP